MIEVYKLDPKAKIPTRAHRWDGGIDIYALEDVYILRGDKAVIRTGIAVHIPEGYVGIIKDRSSMANKGYRVGAGVIDAGYSGEVNVLLFNIANRDSDLSVSTFGTIKAGQKIAQLLIVPCLTSGVIEVKELWNSPRGKKGWGSSDA